MYNHACSSPLHLTGSDWIKIYLLFSCLRRVLVRVSSLVVVDADDTNWHQRWQCQHWMTPIDTRMNWKIIYAGPAGLWKYNKIWSSGKCFWIHETSEMNFLQFLSNLAMKEENYFLGIPKIWVFSSHTTTKV